MKKGVNLIVLIVVVVVMIILASTIILTYSKNNIISEANDMQEKTNLQYMIDMRNDRYRDLLSSHFGDESKIDDRAFVDIVSSEYQAKGFSANKSGITYRGSDTRLKKICIEMGILVP